MQRILESVGGVNMSEPQFGHSEPLGPVRDASGSGEESSPNIEPAVTEAATAHLLAWASELAGQEIVLPEEVRFVEAPLRTVATRRVSWYATQYLRTIASARLSQDTGGWGKWTSEWWRERQEEALGALASLKEAL